MRGIVAYQATIEEGNLTLQRAYAGMKDVFYPKSFEEASSWLTEDFGNSFSIVWNLADFTDALFTLLSQSEIKQLVSEARIHKGNTKIFSIPQWLGLTSKLHIKGNIYAQVENNFFSINNFVEETTVPDVEKLAVIGNELLDAFGIMGVNPSKLTSPVGVYAEGLHPDKYPTIWTGSEELLDMTEWSHKISNYEWHTCYKVGYFPQSYYYDLTSAYPYFISQLPDTNRCEIYHSEEFMPLPGIVHGRITIDADISPIVYDTGSEFIMPKGSWDGYFTTREVSWVEKHRIGSFDFKEGYFIKFKSNNKPYLALMNKLIEARNNDNNRVSYLAKRIAQGVSGKLDELHRDGGYGDFYNSVLATIVRANCRLRLADFIYDNNLQDNVIQIQVDGILADKRIDLPEKASAGEFRIDGDNIPSLVLGKNLVWKPNKKPQGIDFTEALTSHRTIKEAFESQFDSVTKELLKDSRKSSGRLFDSFPRNIPEIFERQYNSLALCVDVL